MLTKYDTKILYQSHIIRVRVMKPDRLSPFLLLAVLNSPVVKKQIRAKQFTQDIIDTLGQRFRELVLPLPKDVEVRQGIEARVRRVVETRADLRQEARALALAVTSTSDGDLEDQRPSVNPVSHPSGKSQFPDGPQSTLVSRSLRGCGVSPRGSRHAGGATYGFRSQSL